MSNNNTRPSPLSIPFLYAFLNSDKMNCVEDHHDGKNGAIYVGSLDAANDIELLKKHNVRAVLTVASNTGTALIHIRSFLLQRSQHGGAFGATGRGYTLLRYLQALLNGHRLH